ncbi:insulin-like growth factor binding protein [Anaeramoeba flamelloides]|uniref:Insulin-like growth factor binding protein n=1 Tax=Anaeramoeba flamelloides TaxID=1746091 RepID=A0ABQ8XT38_9EUKA|nr:insulin-like growth factor binding protein [Anaeramoeba flamelloides]
MKNLIFFHVLFLAFLFCVSFQQCTHYVDRDGFNLNGCTNIDYPCRTISFAYDNMPQNSVLCFASGTYDLLERLDLEKNVTFFSESGPEKTTINCLGGQYSAFLIANIDFTIDGFTVSKFGSTNTAAGAFNIQCLNSNGNTIKIKNSILENNYASKGAAIYNRGCKLKMINVTIRDNTASEGGAGLYCARGDDLENAVELDFENVRVVDNKLTVQDGDYNVVNEMADTGSDLVPSCRVNGYDLKNCDECYNGGNCNLEQGGCDCLPGSALPSPSCEFCNSGLYSTELNSTNCDQCGMGSYNPNNGSITSDDCIPCEAGTYNNDTGQNQCIKCPAGTFNNETNSRTIEDCLSCSMGKYNDQMGASVCRQCSGGSYSDKVGMTKCTQCNEGTYGNKIGSKTSEDCQPCEMGTYNNQMGQTICFSCRAGTYNTESGSANYDDCIKCPRGTYNSQQGSKTRDDCALCQTGTYSNQLGLASVAGCKKCDTGHYSNAEGASLCAACSAGEYAEKKGSTSCRNCSSGTYSDATGLSNCKLCQNGTFQSSTGETACEKCPNGTHNANTGSTTNSDCIACGLGTYQDQDGQSACKLCSTGKFGNQLALTECFDCLPGSHSNKEGQTACEYCEIGEYQDEPGQSECKSSPFNTYTTQSGSTNFLDCPLHSQTLSIRTQTPQECFCTIGYYGMPGERCVKCPDEGVCSKFNQHYPFSQPGYWNSVENPTQIFKCAVEDACPGNAMELCNQTLGYSGFQCSNCISQYYKFEGQCFECPENNSQRLLIAAVLITLFTLILLFIAKKGQNYFGSLSILISFFQIIVLFPGMKLNWPYDITNFFQSLSFFNFNTDYLALECTLTLSYTEKWFAIQLMPFILIIFLALLYLVLFVHSKIVKSIGGKFIHAFPSLCVKPESTEHSIFLRPLIYLRYYFFKFWHSGMDNKALWGIKNNCINAWLAFLFLLYLILCLKILELFDCSYSENLKRYTLNYNTNYYCYDSWWYKMLPFVIIFALLYIVGIPVFLCWVLLYHSKHVNEKTFNARLGLLTSKYKKEWFFWEFVLLIKKFLIVIFYIYLTNYPNAQLTLFYLIILLSIILQLYSNPFNSKPRNFLEFTLLFITLFILFCGLIFSSGELQGLESKRRDSVTNAVIAIVVLSFFLWLIVVVFEIKNAFDSKNKSSKIKKQDKKNQKKIVDNDVGKGIDLLSSNEKKMIKFIRNKNFNIPLLLKYSSSLNNSKASNNYNFYSTLQKYFSNSQIQNQKIKKKCADSKEKYQSLWQNHISIIIAKWFHKKSTLMHKIKISKILANYIEFYIQQLHEEIELSSH